MLIPLIGQYMESSILGTVDGPELRTTKMMENIGPSSVTFEILLPASGAVET